MKYTLVILTALAFQACKHTISNKEALMDITVIRDVTDFHLLKPDANSILSIYNLSANKDVAISFRYREISDKVLTPAVNIVLTDRYSSQRENQSNQSFFREKMIVSFYDTIRKILNIAHGDNDSSTLDNSECFNAICNELTLLSQSTSSNKILLVYSNLFENSTILSVYDEETENLLLSNPDSIKSQFEKSHLLPDNIKGIKIFFVFEPATREEDYQYLKMIEVYKKLLLPKGAFVHVQADNDFQKQ